MAVVLDASMALAWVLRNQSSPASEAVFEAVARDYALVPALWHFEIVGVLSRHLETNQISWQEVESFLVEIGTLDVRSDRQQTPLLDLLKIAQVYTLSGYAAAYLDLAVRSGLPLATSDKRLRAAAKLAGVILLGS